METEYETNNINNKNKEFNSQIKTKANTQNINTKTTRICHRLDINTEKEAAMLIKNQFQNVEEFLKIDNDIIIGKIIDTQKYENLEKIPTYHLIGNKEEIIQSQKAKNLEKSENSEKKNSTKNQKSIQRQKSGLIRKKPIETLEDIQEKNFIKISDEQINYFFKERKIKTANPLHKKTLEGNLYEKIDRKSAKKMKGILSRQEKVLDFNENKEKEANIQAKNISKKTKKDPKELLMNKPDAFRIKNQCLDKMNLDEPDRFFEFGIFNNWAYSLRKNEGRTKNLKTITEKNKILRKDYIMTKIDIRKDTDLGAIIFPNLIKANDENIIKPNSASVKDFRKYANSRAVSAKLKKMNIDCEEFINGNDLNVFIY